MEFEKVWSKILEHQNEIFHTKRGLELKYTVKNDKLYHNRTAPGIPKSQFLKAYKEFPFKGPAEIRDLVLGPAYIYAILTDNRFLG